jgi:hypothetical protein
VYLRDPSGNLVEVDWPDVTTLDPVGPMASEPADVEQAYAAVESWRRYEPPVDFYVLPVIAIDLPPTDVDEREVRFEISAYVRWVNLIGWAGLAIGNLLPVAPRDETVLAAGLAWERG